VLGFASPFWFWRGWWSSFSPRRWPFLSASVAVSSQIRFAMVAGSVSLGGGVCHLSIGCVLCSVSFCRLPVVYCRIFVAGGFCVFLFVDLRRLLFCALVLCTFRDWVVLDVTSCESVCDSLTRKGLFVLKKTRRVWFNRVWLLRIGLIPRSEFLRVCLKLVVFGDASSTL